MKRIVPYVIGLAIASVGYASDKEYATAEEAMKVIGTKNLTKIERNLPDGYKSSKGDGSILRVLSGLYAGTAKIKRTEDGKGYCMGGKPSAKTEDLLLVLEEADVNSDKIVTPSETEDLVGKLFKEFGRE